MWFEGKLIGKPKQGHLLHHHPRQQAEGACKMQDARCKAPTILPSKQQLGSSQLSCNHIRGGSVLYIYLWAKTPSKNFTTEKILEETKIRANSDSQKLSPQIVSRRRPLQLEVRGRLRCTKWLNDWGGNDNIYIMLQRMQRSRGWSSFQEPPWTAAAVRFMSHFTSNCSMLRWRANPPPEGSALSGHA
jgi:hypothetical protein